MKSFPVAQAGAIAFNIVDDSLLILIVRAKKTPDDWIFPKGHIEPEETPEFAAERELAEEAGVRGKLFAPAGELQFRSGHKDVHVVYYLFEFVTEALREEKREIKWCEYDEALNLLSHKGAVDLLKDAFPLLRKRMSPVNSGYS